MSFWQLCLEWIDSTPTSMKRVTYSINYMTTTIGKFEKTQLLARKCIYWPKINGDIAKLVSTCTCNTFKSKQQTEPMHLCKLRSGPWEVLTSDLFECNGSKCLLVCNYYSKFHIVRRLRNETCVHNTSAERNL